MSDRLKRMRIGALMVTLGVIPIALAGVLVAPAYGSNASASSLSLRADGPDVTWDDVAAAQASVDGTAALVKQIQASLASLQAAVDATQADAEAKGEAYGKAQDAYDAEQFKYENLLAQVTAAQAKADAAKKFP